MDLIPGDNGREAQAFFEKAFRLSDPVHDEVFLGHKLSGLLLSACQVGAGDEARKYALIYLEHVIRMRNYEQLIGALAGVAFYLAHFGGEQKASAIWQVVSSQTHIEASQWYQDVIGRVIETVTAELFPHPTVEAADHDLWQTAESLLADLK
jgi:hypothetical protein